MCTPNTRKVINVILVTLTWFLGFGARQDGLDISERNFQIPKSYFVVETITPQHYFLISFCISTTDGDVVFGSTEAQIILHMSFINSKDSDVFERQGGKGLALLVHLYQLALYSTPARFWQR